MEASRRQGVRKQKKRSLLYSQNAAPYFFIFPFILSFLIFFAYPVATTVIMSFQEVLPGQTTFIGLDNYKELWNPTFLTASTSGTGIKIIKVKSV